MTLSRAPDNNSRKSTMEEFDIFQATDTTSVDTVLRALASGQ